MRPSCSRSLTRLVLLDVATRVPGPAGTLPFTSEMLRERPSGDLFGWTQNAGMGWEPSAMTGREFLILSTHGGIRAPDGTPIALRDVDGHRERRPESRRGYSPSPPTSPSGLFTEPNGSILAARCLGPFKATAALSEAMASS